MDILREESIDLVITDQRMPEMTGVQLLEAIGAEFPDLVRMILTGYSDIQAIIHAINTGRLDHYLTKPFEPEALKVTIDRALDFQAVRRRNRELTAELESAAARAVAMREAFQKYVPPPIVEGLLTGGSSVMAGESRIVAVLFSKICGFKELAGRHSPEELVGFLDEYVTAMDGIVLEHKGLLATVVSDEILAVFGVPMSALGNDQRAVDCAWDMRAAIAEINEKHAVPCFGQAIEISIGIHRGELIAGNIGGGRRMQYGVIGDTVNTSARIKSHADPNQILVSSDIVKWAEGDFSEVGAVQLRGKPEPTQLFSVS
jgi:class 3 adenylate cyclase